MGPEGFWARVTRGAPEECWPWTGHQTGRGPRRLSYGTLRLDGKHLHDLRGTIATDLAAAGLSDEDIEDWMGWRRGQAKEMRRVYVNGREVAKRIADRIRKTLCKNAPEAQGPLAA